MEAGRYLVALALVAAAGRAQELRYWVAPCTGAETGCKASDAELAAWAMEAWQGASEGRLKVVRTAEGQSAAIRIHWIGMQEGRYGETLGGDVYVRPEPGEGLTRESVVYLTCLHEIGHALGLRHTAEFADIMYNFQLGGNITEYFARYTKQLSRRAEIRKHSGISRGDREQLLRALGMK